MANLTEGTRVRVRSGMWIRNIASPELPNRRVMRGQEFVIEEGDLPDMERSDVKMHLESLGPDVGDTPPQDNEPDEDAVWGENIDTDALGELLAGMTVPQAKKYLDREEWTEEGLLIAKQAESQGKARDSISDYIDGRIADLAEGDPSDEVDLDDDADDES